MCTVRLYNVLCGPGELYLKKYLVQLYLYKLNSVLCGPGKLYLNNYVVQLYFYVLDSSYIVNALTKEKLSNKICTFL